MGNENTEALILGKTPRIYYYKCGEGYVAQKQTRRQDVKET